MEKLFMSDMVVSSWEYQLVDLSKLVKNFMKTQIPEIMKTLFRMIWKKTYKGCTQQLSTLNKKSIQQSLVENLDQVTTHEEQSDNLCAGSNMPKINNRIRCRLPGEDWVVAVITKSGEKATGRKSWVFILIKQSLRC